MGIEQMNIDDHDRGERRVIVVELNEFNLDLLEQAAEQFDLTTIKSVLQFKSGTTLADQEIEHQGLDPWVQWVSAHAEVPSQHHQVMHLGDAGKLKSRQIWERLGESNITTGVWGLMNAERKTKTGNLYFLADPWSFSADPSHAELQSFGALPVYYAKNYLNPSIKKVTVNAARTAWFILKKLSVKELLDDIVFSLKGVARAGVNNAIMFATFELISSRVYKRYQTKYGADATFIFLNSIAHFQHHHWHSGKLGSTAKHVFSTIDRILQRVLEHEPKDSIVLIANGLSQRNVAAESKFVYRQIDPERFLRRAGIKFKLVEQCMTNDGHVFFETEAELKEAETALSNARLNDELAFQVDASTAEKKLFYQFVFESQIAATEQIRINDSDIEFYEEFALYAQRTGEHVQAGNVLYQGMDLPDCVPLHQLFAKIWPVAEVA